MITNANETKPAQELVIPRYIGVSSVNVLAVNPDNKTLKKYGWTISEDAEEPTYGMSKKEDGTDKPARVCFLVQLMDLEDKPVIQMNFMVRPEFRANASGDKVQIIDKYGQTAWATKEDTATRRVPEYANGPAKITTPYRLCHVGEADLIAFIHKYLNITPVEIYDSAKKAYVPTKDPGKISIDDWNALMHGYAKEIREYMAIKPNNQVKVIFGVRTTDNNRTYQDFMKEFLNNGCFINPVTGVYENAKRIIDRYKASSTSSTEYSAAKIAIAGEPKASEDIKDNLENTPVGFFKDMDMSNLLQESDDDLPFA